MPDNLRPEGSYFNAPCGSIDAIEIGSADVAVIGVPYDGGAPGRRGAVVGPAQLRDATSRWFPYREEPGTHRPAGAINFGMKRLSLHGVRVIDLGDLPCEADAAASDVSAAVERTVRRIVASGARPVVCGGDHSISYGVVAGLDARGPLGILHLDAHPDFVLEKNPPLTHATWVTHARRLPHVSYLAQIGQRGWYPVPEPLAETLASSSAGGADEIAAALRGAGVDHLVTADHIAEHGTTGALDALPAGLNWHVSLDIDVLDPGESLGTAAAVPMGLTAREARAVLRAAAARLSIVSIDVVEVCDGLLDRHVTSDLAAWLLIDLLDGVCRRRPAST